MKRNNLLTLILLAASLTASAQKTTQELVVNAQKPGAVIQPTMYGIFFEDINFAADGGLYAELVKNRSFEFPQRLQGWKSAGNVTVREDGPFDRNPHYVRLADPGHAHKRTMLENEGFFGIGIQKDKEYRFSVWARVPNGTPAQIRVELVNLLRTDHGNMYFNREKVTIDSKEWKKYTVTMKAAEDCQKAVLRIFLEGTETVDLEHVSLFPVDTWKGHENGMRKDLAQALADLKPGVFRFPGGCIVEGSDLATRYQWKNSVGPVENRPLNQNRWQYTFPHRFYADYYQSYGLGFYEYFLLSEEIGSEPLPILSVGLACQYQNDDLSAHQPVDQLDEYVQDALDLIEFANGSTDTQWGKLRAEMGHPKPFNLKFLGIGNEQWGPEYPERLEVFVKALRQKHPEIKLVGSSGPSASGEQFDYLWPEMNRLGADLVDEHYYQPEEFFLTSADRYDSYSRKGAKVFAGEYACHEKGKGWNHYHAALMEAAFMTGLERNADIVHMATYAPLFAHVEGWQWRPDMIWYDNTRVARTCSYYVQQLYSLYKGTNVLPLTMNNKPVIGAEGQDGLYATACLDKDKGLIYIKVVNVTKEALSVPINLKEKKKKGGITDREVECIRFSCADPDAENTMDNPDKIKPERHKFTLSGNVLQARIAPESFCIYVIPAK